MAKVIMHRGLRIEIKQRKGSFLSMVYEGESEVHCNLSVTDCDTLEECAFETGVQIGAYLERKKARAAAATMV